MCVALHPPVPLTVLDGGAGAVRQHPHVHRAEHQCQTHHAGCRPGGTQHLPASCLTATAEGR